LVPPLPRFRAAAAARLRSRQRPRPPSLWRVRGLVTPTEAESLAVAASGTDSNMLFARDADSVDGRPTDEMCLLRDGRATLHGRTGLRPLLWRAQAIWTRVEEYAKFKLGCIDCVVCTSLLRRYGTGSSRSNVPLHFDEYALATAIVSLDPAAGFEGGLVIQSTSGSKRFLAELDQGDMLFHSYDLLHGVDVRAGARRSLIMWISSDAASCATASTPWKERNARHGDRHAQFQLARTLLLEGNSSEARMRGLHWLKESAQRGHATAQLNWGLEKMKLGHVHSARHWWLKAATQGVTQAAHNLGMSLFLKDAGNDALDSPARGMQWLRKAAALGDGDAAAFLKGCLLFHPPCLS